MEKCGEAIATAIIPNDEERHYTNQACFVGTIMMVMKILRVYIQSKKSAPTYELYDSTVEWLKFATLSLKKQDLEDAVSKFLNTPSLNTAQEAYQAYDNFAKHIGSEIFKDEVKHEINKVC